jgi:hypothetical protein
MKSKKPPARPARHVAADPGRRSSHTGPAIILDYVQSRIEAFNDRHGGGIFVRKDAKGYTLIRADNGEPVARLRPRGAKGRFEVLYWNRYRDRWRPVGPFGSAVLGLDDALEFIADDPMGCFWE